MRLSIALSQRLNSQTVLYAQRAERLGFDGVYVFDHLVPPAGSDGGALAVEATLGAVAASVPRVLVGTMVLNVTLRSPATTQRIARTLTAVAPNRGVVGLGMSDSVSREAMEQFGFPFLPVAQRTAILAATIAALADVEVATVVGGNGQAVASLAGRCDGWNLWEPTRSQLSEAVAVHPRVSVSLRARRPFDATWVDSVRAYVSAGCDELILAVLPATDPRALSDVADALSG